MPHYYPVVIQAGKSLAGDSLGFHAYSLRIDNLTNQWLLEETSLAWIPPYSLGVCLRLYGTGVAIILNQAPAGQPQLTSITGEQSVGVYSDQIRTEVAGTPVRQFSAVQSVSDLTTGAMPATPPAGIDRLWADNNGNINHLHADGTSRMLVDASNVVTALYPTTDPHYQAMINASLPNVGATALGGNLTGTVSNGNWLSSADIHTRDVYASRGDTTGVLYFGNNPGNRYLYYDGTNYNFAGTPGVTSGGIFQGYYFYTSDGSNGLVQSITGTLFLRAANNIVNMDGSNSLSVGGYIQTGSYIVSGSYLRANNGVVYLRSDNAVYLQWDGTWIRTSNQFLVTGNLVASGNFYPSYPSQASIFYGFDGAATSGGSIVAGGCYSSAAMTIAGRCYAMQAWGGNLGNTNAFLTPNIGDYRGQGLAWQWATWSSVDHARQYGLPVSDIKDPMVLVNSISGYYYAHSSIKGDGEPILQDNGEVESHMTYGFAAKEVNAQIPEMAGDDWVDTSRLIAILWEGVKEIDTRLRAIEQQ